MILFSSVENIGIKKISVALPTSTKPVTDFNEVFGEDVVRKFSDMTGVKSYQRANMEQTASDLGFEASRKIFEAERIDKRKIKFLVFVTQKPDFRSPSTAFLLHKRLGLEEDCMCFDLNLACSGFIYGLHAISSLLASSSEGDQALLITGDTSSRTYSPLDRTLIMLFGDSGTATLIEKGVTDSTLKFALRTDGSKFKSIVTPSGAYRNRGAERERVEWSDGIERSDYDTHMKGMDVFGFSITDVPKLLKDFLKYTETPVEDYDILALHQANLYILKQISRKLKAPMEKIPVALDRFGNNSSNSVPLAIADHYGQSDDHEEKRILMSGFGAGLSWGCCDAELSPTAVLPLHFSDKAYK
jgi:3-oxoacyl-[acyl-carrier-protein] synthase-3